MDAGYAAGWGLVKAVPLPVSQALFRAGADLAARRNGPGIRQLRANLRRVVGPAVSDTALDALVRDALRSYARYWLETFRLENTDHRAVVESSVAEGENRIADALALGRGVVVALPHSGNWDAAGMWLVARHGSFTTVAERLRPDSVFDRFVAYRRSLGMEILPATGGLRPPMEVLAERLRANGVVCLVADRDVSGTGVDVDFFGQTARMPGGPTMLALRTGATLLAAHTWFAGPGWGLRMSAPLHPPGARLRERVAAGTQQLADYFATYIARHPQDWHMLQPLWAADLAVRARPPGRAALAAAAART